MRFSQLQMEYQTLDLDEHCVGHEYSQSGNGSQHLLWFQN